ncbi:MAG: hypothetical protein ABJ360_07770 [Roseobacter sp.]
MRPDTTALLIGFTEPSTTLKIMPAQNKFEKFPIGENMKNYFFGIALSSLLFVSACTTETHDSYEVWETIEGCKGNELCTYTTLMVDEFNKLAAEPPRRGVSLRDVETDGKVVSIAVDIPESAKNELDGSKRTPDQQVTEILQKEVCSAKTARRFLEIGGQLQLYTYLPSGELFSKSTIKSC